LKEKEKISKLDERKPAAYFRSPEKKSWEGSRDAITRKSASNGPGGNAVEVEFLTKKVDNEPQGQERD